MPLFQIFKTAPDDNVIFELLQTIGFGTFDNPRKVSKSHLEEPEVIEAFVKLQPILVKYYLPCKAKVYIVENPNSRNIITCVRQFLRIKKWKLEAKEIYRNGKKNLIYFMVPDKKKINAKKLAITFD